jgi:hypothetical protein
MTFNKALELVASELLDDDDFTAKAIADAIDNLECDTGLAVVIRAMVQDHLDRAARDEANKAAAA